MAHRDGRFDRSDGAEELEAARPFHHHVGEDEVDLGRRLDHLERLRRVRRRLRAVAALLAQNHDRVRLEGVVLDEQQTDHVGPRRERRVRRRLHRHRRPIRRRPPRLARHRLPQLAVLLLRRAQRRLRLGELRREDLAAALPLDELRRQPRYLARLPVQLLGHTPLARPRRARHAGGGGRRHRDRAERRRAPRPRALLERAVARRRLHAGCAGRVHLVRLLKNCDGVASGVQAAVDGGADESAGRHRRL